MKRNLEYYEKFEEEMAILLKKIDHHVNQAIRCKQIYDETKNRRGVFKMINKLAKKGNLYHVSKGYALGIPALDELWKEITYLEKRIDD